VRGAPLEDLAAAHPDLAAAADVRVASAAEAVVVEAAVEEVVPVVAVEVMPALLPRTRSGDPVGRNYATAAGSDWVEEARRQEARGRTRTPAAWPICLSS
jgi:hypothetical protein